MKTFVSGSIVHSSLPLPLLLGVRWHPLKVSQKLSCINLSFFMHVSAHAICDNLHPYVRRLHLHILPQVCFCTAAFRCD